MPNTSEDEVIRKLREYVARGELSGVDVSYRVTGGTPGEQPVHEELRLSGLGPVHAQLRTTASFSAPEMKSLLLEISEGVDELTPQSEARFVPDSIIGQVSVRVDGKEASFFFLPDEEQAKQQGKALPPKAMRSVSALDRLHKRILPR